MTTPPRPISLSDDQLTAVMRAAAPLQPYDREAFLVAVATMFGGREAIGDGELGRAIRELQRLYFKPPSEIETAQGAPRPLKKLKLNAQV
jgi:hypothetical protein